MNHTKQHNRMPAIFGLILIALGALLVANQFEVIPFRLKDVLFTWQSLLILIGVLFLSSKDSRITGFILVGVGGFFLIPDFFIVPEVYRKLFWPAALIVFGLVILFGRRKCFLMNRKSTFDSNLLEDINIFGGSERNITADAFRGGSVISILGGGKYDFTGATLSKEDNILELISVFGGVKMIVPDDWDVKVELVSVFGGFTDKRKVTVVDKDKRITIKGISLFGGGEMASY